MTDEHDTTAKVLPPVAERRERAPDETLGISHPALPETKDDLSAVEPRPVGPTLSLDEEAGALGSPTLSLDEVAPGPRAPRPAPAQPRATAAVHDLAASLSDLPARRAPRRPPRGAQLHDGFEAPSQPSLPTAPDARPERAPQAWLTIDTVVGVIACLSVLGLLLVFCGA